MFQVKLNDGFKLICYSEWDSGTHKGFKCLVHESGEYTAECLSEYLSPEQIHQVELVILQTVKGMLNEKA